MAFSTKACPQSGLPMLEAIGNEEKLGVAASGDESCNTAFIDVSRDAAKGSASPAVSSCILECPLRAADRWKLRLSIIEYASDTLSRDEGADAATSGCFFGDIAERSFRRREKLRSSSFKKENFIVDRDSQTYSRKMMELK